MLRWPYVWHIGFCWLRTTDRSVRTEKESAHERWERVRDHLPHFTGENDSDHRSLTYALALFSMIARARLIAVFLLHRFQCCYSVFLSLFVSFFIFLLFMSVCMCFVCVHVFCFWFTLFEASPASCETMSIWFDLLIFFLLLAQVFYSLSNVSHGRLCWWFVNLAKALVDVSNWLFIKQCRTQNIKVKRTRFVSTFLLLLMLPDAVVDSLYSRWVFLFLSFVCYFVDSLIRSVFHLNQAKRSLNAIWNGANDRQRSSGGHQQIKKVWKFFFHFCCFIILAHRLNHTHNN